MSRCGCSRGGSGGVLVPGPGLEIEGDGTPQRPRVIKVVPDPHVCDIVTGCLSSSLCRGLSYDGTCVGMDLSAEDGNVLSFAEDGGLFGQCDTAVTCGVTVDNLPAFVIGGTYAAGWNNGPPVAESYERAVSLGVPLSMSTTQRLADGTYLCAASDLNSGANTPTSNRGFHEISSNAARSILYDHETAWEWCRPQRSLDSLPRILDIVRGRHVTTLRAPREASAPQTGTVQELVDQVVNACAQANVIITSEGPEATAADRQRLSVARSAGLLTGVYIRVEADAAIHPPAALVAEGVKWAFIHRGVSDAVIQTYVSAGLQVIVTRVNLRVEVARAQSLGVRGVTAEDPAYASGRLSPRRSDPWAWPNWANGQMGPAQIVRSIWRNQVGQTCTRDGWSTTAVSAGWRMPDEDPGAITGAVLLGWAAPLPSKTAYTITWEQWWQVLDGNRRNSNSFGLVIGALDDAMPINDDQTAGPNTGPGRTSGYVLLHQVGDPAAPTNTTMTINRITKGAAAGAAVGATGTKQHLAAGSWVRFRVIVTATTITYQRLTSANAVQYAATVTDSTHRGDYIWAVKLQGGGTTGSQRLATAYRNMTITTP